VAAAAALSRVGAGCRARGSGRRLAVGRGGWGANPRGCYGSKGHSCWCGGVAGC